MVTRSNSYPDRRLNGLHIPLDAPFPLSGSSQGLSHKDLSTTDPDENHKVVTNPRHFRQPDKVLHIHSLDSNTDSFRNLRAVLLQLRDSLSSGTSSSAEIKVNQGSLAANGTHSDVPRKADCRHDNLLGMCAQHSVDNKRRPERISLPNFYLADYNKDDESTRSSETDLRWRLTSSLRHRANVKFADEFGLNLNTFVMIPSRFQRTGSPPTTQSGVNVEKGSMNNGGVGGSKAISLSSKFIELSGDCRYALKPSIERGITSKCVSPLCLEPSNKVKSNVAADGFASSRSSSHCALTSIEEDSRDAVTKDIFEPQFRLCFDQPFADQERFHARLNSQKVCLENVRVENWSLDGNVPPSPSSSPPASLPILAAANSVILCSIRVSNLHPEKVVFARCTDNDWVTFTDLPAQHVGKIDSLGYAHDRFCFAVRRPLYTGNFLPPSSAVRAQVAVEFAVCYKVSAETYWDNNDGANYRIEWF